MERLRPLPGLDTKCGDCRKYRKNPTELGFQCKAAWAPFGVPLQPKIEEAADGSIICDSFGPRLSIRIKNLVGRASVFAITRGIQLPQ